MGNVDGSRLSKLVSEDVGKQGDRASVFFFFFVFFLVGAEQLRRERQTIMIQWVRMQGRQKKASYLRPVSTRM